MPDGRPLPEGERHEVTPTLVVDLASDPRKTGVCTMRWEDGSAHIAPAAALGLTDECPGDLRATARTEGWIYLPTGGTLPTWRRWQ